MPMGERPSGSVQLVAGIDVPGSSTREAHVSAHALTRVYPGFGSRPPLKALGPIDLDIARGEFFSVVGPSGCGKSTLLDVVAGLAPKTEGSLIFEGRPVGGTV